jgi:hypothetical protein
MIRTLATAVFVALLGLLVPASAADAPVQLTWKQLIPPSKTAKPLKSLFSRQDRGEEAPPADTPEAGWMSRKNGESVPVEVVSELDGKVVEIAGYVVPLDFDATAVKEFLLVPYVGACIHVPPPPANQIIYVSSAKGFELKGLFTPVKVKGKIHAAFTPTGLADTGYSLDAELVADFK